MTDYTGQLIAGTISGYVFTGKANNGKTLEVHCDGGVRGINIAAYACYNNGGWKVQFGNNEFNGVKVAEVIFEEKNK